MEILAKDLLKIDRSAKKMKEVVGVVSDRDEFFYSEVERFVSMFALYLWPIFVSLCCRYEKKLVTLDKDCRETQKLYDELVVKFGENNSVDSEELFGFIKVFVEKFRDMCVKLDAPKKEKAESVSP